MRRHGATNIERGLMCLKYTIIIVLPRLIMIIINIIIPYFKQITHRLFSNIGIFE